MNYKLISNEENLKFFIDWLPDLKPTEKFYVTLFARKKYDTKGVIKKDKAQLKRVLATKSTLIDKIRQMEIAVGGYKVDGVSVPQETLAVYITPNPRCLKRAFKTLAKRSVEVICENIDANPVSEALTAVHQSLGTNFVKDFDFDNVDLNVTLEEVYKVVNKSAVHIVLTRGGFHVLVEMTKIQDAYKKIWYQGICKIAGCDVRGDNLLPVVGCVQGGYEPKFYY